MSARMDKLQAKFEAHSGQKVQLLYAGSRIGAWSALVQTEIFAGAAAATDSAIRPWASAPNARIERKDGKATKLPTSFYIFVTGEDLHFRTISGFLFWTFLGKELGVFSRKQLDAFASDQKITRRFGLIDRERDQAVAFEGFCKHHLTDELTELIGARVVTGPEEL